MTGHENRQSAAGEDRIERALRRAGPRPVAPDTTVARVRASIESEWEAVVRRRSAARLRKRVILAALAASVVVAFFSVRTLWRDGLPGADGAAVARLQIRSGDVRLRPPIGSAGGDLAAGTRIDSGADGRLALRMATGPSVRIDAGTSLRVASSEILILDRGRVYVDSGTAGAPSDRPLIVRTPIGEVRDVGTQFVVDLDDSRMRVRVREGLVGVSRDGVGHEATAGQELTLGPGDAVSRRTVLPYGPEWDWVGSVAPAPQIHGRPLGEFLDWVTRETGRSIVFTDAETAKRSGEIVLSGSIEGRTPLEALDSVLPTCDLVHRLDAGRIVIDVARERADGE
jgi:hypothetical protein